MRFCGCVSSVRIRDEGTMTMESNNSARIINEDEEDDHGVYGMNTRRRRLPRIMLFARFAALFRARHDADHGYEEKEYKECCDSDENVWAKLRIWFAMNPSVAERNYLIVHNSMKHAIFL